MLGSILLMAVTAVKFVPCEHDSVVAREARAAHVPVMIAMAVVRVESACQTRAVSNTGARGLMQIMPSWMRSNLQARCGSNLWSARVNACYGTRILRHEYVRCRHDWKCALRWYNGGPRPPIPSTIQYTRDVLRHLPILAAHFKEQRWALLREAQLVT